MKKKLALLFGYLFIGIGLITAQTQKVTGTVISDDDKQPVVGASIVVKGTNLGTITDIAGHRQITVDLVRYNQYMVFFAKCTDSGKLFLTPDLSCRILRIT